MNGTGNREWRPILGQVPRDEFVGRADELQKLVAGALRSDGPCGQLVLATPHAGVSEFLRQAYDELFHRRGNTVPIYFAFAQSDNTAVSASIEFLNAFLIQYLAFQRNEPALCGLALTLNEIAQLAPANDLIWIDQLIDEYNRQRFAEDDRELVRLCLTAPRRVPQTDVRVLIMVDMKQVAMYSESDSAFEKEIVKALGSCGQPFVLAGLRRDIVQTVERARADSDRVNKIYLDRLVDKDARQLVVNTARRLNVAVNDETRDLLVQQLECSPFFITAMLQAAHEKQMALDSYLACERLYVDELLGGRLHRHFAFLLERIVPEVETWRAVVSLLCESLPAGRRTTSFDAWSRRLRIETEELERIVGRLHAEELINRDGETIDAEDGAMPWRDYLRSRFRLDVLREPRALVVADVMAAALKRAPQTVNRYYRRVANLHLRDLLDRFNFQMLPRQLFSYDQFADAYKGASRQEIAEGLDSDTDLLRLPQVFHSASGVSFSAELRQFGDEVSVVAHGFDGAAYTDDNEIVWLVARINGKLEVEPALAEAWCDRLISLGQRAAIVRMQIWLVAKEGFSPEACQLLHERGAFYSSQQQFEIVAERIGQVDGPLLPPVANDEIELVLPMGSDYELLAASTVEQIARRLNFRPEAINQIKTAIVEACINASEHSLSPDRKIYQRFRVEDDKLVVIISSRGIVPSNLSADDDAGTGGGIEEVVEQRRGWGLKLIRTLMDEVEFERVDEGTSLRMSKYVRKGS